MMEHALTVRPSGREDLGLFALTPLEKDERLLEYCGEKICKSESARRKAAHNNYIFHLDYSYDIDGSDPENLARYINHCCEPNCRIEICEGRIFVVSQRNIQEGEELSFNYGYDARDYEKFPCNCGSKGCCGYILGREYWGLIPPVRPRFDDDELDKN